jgi:hypothetical protein
MVNFLAAVVAVAPELFQGYSLSDEIASQILVAICSLFIGQRFG